MAERTVTQSGGGGLPPVQPLALYQPPPPVLEPVVVDRVAYLQQQRMRQIEEHRRQQEAEQLAYQRMEEQRQREMQYRALTDERGLPTFINQAIGTGLAGLGEAQKTVNVSDYYDRTSGTEAERRQQAYNLAEQEALLRSQVIPNVRLQEQPNDSIMQAGASIYTSKVPGLSALRQQAGEVGRKIGEASGIPGAGATGEFIGEAAVPVRTWEVAADLVGGNLAVDVGKFAARRLLTSAKDAGFELTVDGVWKFAASLDGQKIIKALQSETGSLDNEKIVASLEEQRANLSRALKVLKAGEVARLTTGGVKDAFSLAERYLRGSTEREAIIDATRPKLSHLPETVQKFAVKLMETLPGKAERVAATEAQRARQFARASDVFDETQGTVEEKAIAAFKAKGGKQAQRFTPIGEHFTPDETQELMQRIPEAAANKTISVFERDRAISALHLLMTGERLPGVRSEAEMPLNLSQGEIKLLGKIFGPEIEAVLPKTPAHMRSWLSRMVDYANLPRAIVTALDISAAGRQGILLAARNPVEWGKSFPVMIRAMGSEEGFNRMATQIRQNQRYEDAIRHGLDFSDIGGGHEGEEAFISRLASKIPGIRGSERGYVAFLDNLRMLTYEKYANRVERLAKDQGWEVERLDLVKSQVAKFLNVASGRGDLKLAGEFTPALNAIFFSPRFLISRPQSIWAMVRPGADPVTRRIAFENLGAFVATGVGMLTVAKMMGADVEIDPRSSDFGKMRFGNTRIDFWGGYQPIARYIAQFSTGKNKELFTGDVKDVYPGKTALRFFRSKLAPSGSMIYDYTVGEGKTYNGDDTFFRHPTQIGIDSRTRDRAWSDFAQRIVPLSIQDAVNGYQESGIFGGIAAGAVSSLGGGVSSFSASEEQQKKIEKSGVEKKLTEAGVPFTGNKIDYASSLLDKTVQTPSGRTVTWREGLAAGFGYSLDEVKGLSYTEMQAKWVKDHTETLQKRGLTAAAAKDQASRGVKTFPWVKAMDNAAEKALLQYWRAHPDKLREAIDAGLVGGSEAKDKILAGAP